jgi:hypothetical protein
MRPNDSALVTFPVYATMSSDSDIGVILIDYFIGVKELDVDIDVILTSLSRAEYQRAGGRVLPAAGLLSHAQGATHPGGHVRRR